MSLADIEVGANPFPGIEPGMQDEYQFYDNEDEDDEMIFRDKPLKKLLPKKTRRLRKQGSVAKIEKSTDQIEADLKAVAKRGLSKEVSEAMDQIGEEFADVDIAEQRAIMERIEQANNGFNTILSKPLSLLHTQTNAPKRLTTDQSIDTVMESSPFDIPTIIVTPPTSKMAFTWQTPSTTENDGKLSLPQPNKPNTQTKKVQDFKWCDHCRYGGGHNSKECPEWKPMVGKCLNCGKIGSHFTTKCPQKCRNCAESHHVGICPLPLKRPLHDV